MRSLSKQKARSCQPSATSQAGFTLLEILAVLAILGLLMGLMFPAMGTVKRNVHKHQTQWQFSEVIGALQDYRLHYGEYPSFLKTVNKPLAINAFTQLFVEALQGVANGTTPSIYNPDNWVFREFPGKEFDGNGRWCDDLGQSDIFLILREPQRLTIPRSCFPARLRDRMPVAGLAEAIAIFSLGDIPSQDITSWK